jgi:hypothetical protein
MASADWTIAWEDVVDGRILRSAEDWFTDIFIVYTDRDTGQERVAIGRARDAAEVPMLLERAVRVKNPIEDADAKALADRAAALGQPGPHGFITLRLDRPLAHRTGTRSAADIREGDTVSLPRNSEPLHVFGLTRDVEAGTVLLVLGEQDQGERLELELTFMRLERGG